MLAKAMKAFMLFFSFYQKNKSYNVYFIRKTSSFPLLWKPDAIFLFIAPFCCLSRCYDTVAMDASRPLRERDARSVLWCDVTSS